MLPFFHAKASVHSLPREQPRAPNRHDTFICPHPSFFLAASGCLLFPFASHDLSKHYHAVAVQECDARKTLAVFEAVAHKRLLWLKGTLSHFVRLQRMGIFHFFPTSLLPHLPLEPRDTARRPATAHETNGRIPNFNLARDIEYLNLSVEF